MAVGIEWTGVVLELAPLREAWGGLYTMVLDIIITCKQNITYRRLQGVDEAGVATIFGKMRGVWVFVEARAGR